MKLEITGTDEITVSCGVCSKVEEADMWREKWAKARQELDDERRVRKMIEAELVEERQSCKADVERLKTSIRSLRHVLGLIFKALKNTDRDMSITLSAFGDAVDPEADA